VVEFGARFTVVKAIRVDLPTDAPPFPFSWSFGQDSDTVPDFGLDADGPGAASRSQSVLEPGADGSPVSVAELVDSEFMPAVWRLSTVSDEPAIVCTDAFGGEVEVALSPDDADVQNRASLLLGRGQDVTCTFLNEYEINVGIGLEKTADPAVVLEGQETTYTLTATNVGNWPLGPLAGQEIIDSISDTKCAVLGGVVAFDEAASVNWDGEIRVLSPEREELPANPGIGFPGQSAEPAETWVFTCTTGPLTLAEADPGTDVITNVGTVTVGDPRSGDGSGQLQDSDDAVVEVLAADAAITKTADRVLVSPGTAVTYTYVATNPGDVPLTQVSVVDDKCSPVEFVSGDADSDGLLDPGEAWTYTCTAVILVTTHNVATLTGYPVPPTGEPDLGDPLIRTAEEDVTVLVPVIDVVKTAATPVGGRGTPKDLLVPSGSTVTYTYEVTTGGSPVAMRLDSISDDKCSPVLPAVSAGNAGDADGDGLVDPGETWVFTCDIVVPADADIVNTVTVEATEPQTGGQDSDTDTARVRAYEPEAPGIAITKTASKTTVVAGERVTYTYEVVNTGNVELRDIELVDDKCEPVEYQRGDRDGDEVLDLEETWVFECTMRIFRTTTNVAVVTGTSPEGTPVEDEDTETVVVIAPGIEVVKTASATTVVAGDQVTYTYQVRATGDVAIEDVVLVDDKCSPVVLKSGDSDGDAVLDLGETWVYTCTQVITRTTTNVATVTGKTPDGTPVEDEDEETVTVVEPGIQITKTASSASVAPGTQVTFTYTVVNTGDTDLVQVSVGDDKCSPVVLQSGDSDGDAVLDQDETWVYTCTQKISSTTTNVATVTGQTPGGTPVTDTDEATVTVTAPPIVKTGSPAWAGVVGLLAMALIAAGSLLLWRRREHTA